MKKEGFVFGFFLLSLTMFLSLVSAAIYGGTIFQNALNYLDPLMLLFLIFFAPLFFIFSKFFRDNTGLAGIMAVSISLLAIYGINRYGFDYNNLFSNIFFFIPEDILYTFLPLLILVIIGVLWWKLGFGITTAGVGAFFLVASFFFEEGLTTAVIGIVLLIIGGFFLLRKKKPNLGGGIGKGDWQGTKWAGNSSLQGMDYAKQKWQNQKRREGIEQSIHALEKKKREFEEYLESVYKSTKVRVPSRDNPFYQGWRKATDTINEIEKQISSLKRQL